MTLKNHDLSPLQEETLLLLAVDSARAFGDYDEKHYTHRTEIHIPERQIIVVKRPTITVLLRYRLISGNPISGPWTITDRGRVIAALIEKKESYSL